MRIHMAEENWLAMLEFVPRRVLGNKVDKVGNRYFAKIAQDCLHSKFKHIRIGYLYIDTGEDNRITELRKKQEDDNDGEVVPIADVDMPENIRGFDKILIGNLDAIGLEFLTRMRALFNNVALNFEEVDGQEPITTATARVALAFRDLLPLINGGPAVELIEVCRVFLPILQENFPATFFNTKFLEVLISTNTMDDPSMAEVLADWLFTPHADGQSSRMLGLYLDCNNDDATEPDANMLAMELGIVQQFVTAIQQRFVDQTRQQASPFSVLVYVGNAQAQELASTTGNGQTGEQLIIKWHGNAETSYDEGNGLIVLNCTTVGVDDGWVDRKGREIKDSSNKERPKFIFT